jgi:hypothetical protein
MELDAAQTYAQIIKNKINELFPLPPAPIIERPLFDFDRVKRSPAEMKLIEESKDLVDLATLYLYFGAWAAIYYYYLKNGGGGPIF